MLDNISLAADAATLSPVALFLQADIVVKAVMIGLLMMYGFPESAAVTATLICRLATLWFAVGLGAVFLARHR